jgi:hypothetical protein
MADKSVDLYRSAAGELELATRHYREAAAHYEHDEPHKAAHHAHIARGHFLNAQAFAHDAARAHAQRYSSEVLNAPDHQ